MFLFRGSRDGQGASLFAPKGRGFSVFTSRFFVWSGGFPLLDVWELD
jgi:hypothetical protein